MRKRIGVVLLFVLVQVWAIGVFAEEIHVLDTVTVEARREPSAEGNAVTIDIQSEAPAVAASVPDMLDQLSGLDVQKRSVLTPKSSQVKIRGMDERRSLIMLDGRPLNGTGVMGGQFVDWSTLTVGNWQAIDVGKGAFSAKYGNTLGGSINLIPAELGADPTASASAGYKRYDTYSVDASASARNDSIGGTFLRRVYRNRRSPEKQSGRTDESRRHPFLLLGR